MSSAASEVPPASVELISIPSGGSYSLSGVKKDVTITIDAGEEDVILVLDGVTIQNSNAPAIYVKSAGKTTVTLAEESTNTLSNGSSYSIVDGGSALDAVLFSRAEQGVIAAYVGEQTAGIRIQLENGTADVLSDTPEIACNVVVCSTDQLKRGDIYTVTIGNFSEQITAK